MKKSITGALALAATGALLLAGCSTADEPGGTNTSDAPQPTGDALCIPAGSVIGVSLPQKTSENWVLAEQLFNDGLKDAGFEPIVQFGNSGVTEQQNQISAMVENGAKVIIVGAIDGSQLGGQLEDARAAGASVIAYDRLLMNTEAVDAYIAFDNRRVGQLQGEALLQGLSERKGDGPWNIELIAGSPDDANATPFFEGALDILQPKIDDGTLTVVSGQTSFEQVATQGWKAENAQKRMDTVLVSAYADGTELHGILSPNDTLARAALTAVSQAGLDTPVITGQDSEVESVKLIMEGVQFSTIYKDTRDLVAQSIKSVVELQNCNEIPINDTDQYDNGVKVVPAYLLDPIIVTKANAAEVYALDPTLGPLTQ